MLDLLLILLLFSSLFSVSIFISMENTSSLKPQDEHVDVCVDYRCGCENKANIIIIIKKMCGSSNAETVKREIDDRCYQLNKYIFHLLRIIITITMFRHAYIHTLLRINKDVLYFMYDNRYNLLERWLIFTKLKMCFYMNENF